MGRLTALGVKNISEPGKYHDGDGLILQVTKSKQGLIKRSWLVRYGFNGKRREMGIGPYPLVSLALARQEKNIIKLSVLKGVDPIEERRALKQEQVSETDDTVTFEKCAERYIAIHEPSWANPKHRQQWRNTLKTYAYPKIGRKDVGAINIEDMMQILKPIWTTKTETANRV